MENGAITGQDAAALLQGGMRPAEVRTLLRHGLDLDTYLGLDEPALTGLGLHRVNPEHHDLGDCEILLETDPRYPAQLKATRTPPVLLYVRGNIEALEPGVGVIGTREMTRIGEAVAEAAVSAAAAVPAPVISGLARGCDITAHRAALRQGCRTVAVLACGLDTTYPAEHRSDVDAIIGAGGAVVSEQPFGVPVNPQRLMARNRIIIGLSACIIPCEAARNSRGTLQAIGTAFEEDRFVIVARVRESWRNAPGAWLSERLALGDTPAERFGWKPRGEQPPAQTGQKPPNSAAGRNTTATGAATKGGTKKGVAANGAAETGADLAEMVKFSVLFARA